jgi:hypothetical protein
MQSRESPTWCLGPLRIPLSLVFAPIPTHIACPDLGICTIVNLPRCCKTFAYHSSPTPHTYLRLGILATRTQGVAARIINHPTLLSQNIRVSLQPCSLSQLTLVRLGIFFARTKHHPLNSFDATPASAGRHDTSQRITHRGTLSPVRPALSVGMLVLVLSISPSSGRNKRQRNGTSWHLVGVVL